MLKGLRIQVVVFILAVVLTTVAFLSVFVEYRSRVYFVEVSGKALSGLARNTSLELDRQLSARLREVESLAEMPDFRAAMLGNCQRSFVVRSRLKAARNNTGAYEWIGIADKRGRVCISDSDSAAPDNVAKHPVFKQGMKAPWLGESLRATGSNGVKIWGVDLAAPVLGPDNRPIATVIARLDRRWLSQIRNRVLMPLVEGNGTSAAVLNRSGRTLMVTGEADLSAFGELDIKGLLEAGTPWQRQQDSQGKKWVRGFGSAGSDGAALGWTVVLSEPLSVAFAPLFAFRIDLLAGTVFLLIFSIYIAVPVSRQLTRPIKTLSEAAGSLSRGESMSIPEIRGIYELEVLSQSLRKMVDSLTSSERALLRMQDHALRDGLTGLFNRRGLDEFLADRREHIEENERIGLMYIDLDRFKVVNDEFGHAAGDAVLKAVAERMQSTFRESDFLSRLGGDEFLVMLSHKQDAPAPNLVELSRRLIERLRSPVMFEGTELAVSASIGIAYWDQSKSLDDAMAEADAALYEAKAEGRDRVVFASGLSGATPSGAQPDKHQTAVETSSG